MASLINFGPDLPQLGPVSMFAPHGPRRDGLIVHEEPNVAAQMLSLAVAATGSWPEFRQVFRGYAEGRPIYVNPAAVRFIVAENSPFA